MSRDTLLIDFGGVLTTSPDTAFADFGRAEGLGDNAFVSLIRRDREAHDLLLDVETGAIDEPTFEQRFAPLLGEGVAAAGLLRRLTATLAPDERMLAAMAALREQGVPMVLVSNSFGMHAYDGYELESLFDHIVISGDVGSRKPSRAIYEIALERAETSADRAVFVDDLAHNVAAAERLGMAGILHASADATLPQLAEVLGVPCVLA